MQREPLRPFVGSRSRSSVPICPHHRLSRNAPARPSKGFHIDEAPRSSLDTIAGVRAEGEVGIQRDDQDFKPSVLRGYLVTLDFWVAIASCFLFTLLCRAVGSWLALVSASTMLRGENQQREVICMARYVKVRDWTVRHKLVKGGW